MARFPMDRRRSTRWLTYTASALALAVLGVTLPGATVFAQDTATPSGLGHPATEAELRDSLVGPNGADLPVGRGTAIEGAGVFERRGGTTFHGPPGTEGPFLVLVGGQGTTGSNY